MKSESEQDYLQYTGYKVPRIIRMVWTVFIVFGLVYLVKYMWPDLAEWIQKIK